MARNRKNRKRKERKVYAIIVDGETEVWYFQMMKRHEDLPNVTILPELPRKRKLKNQYDAVIEKLEQGYDKVIWLIDFDVLIKEERDTRKGQKSKIQEFREYYDRLHKYKGVEILINTPCLEFWYLLHFQQTSKFYSKCEDATQNLKKYLPNYEKTQKYYKKYNDDIYLKLKPIQNDGRENAKRLGKFSFEEIYLAKAEIHEILDILTIPIG